MLTLTPRLTTFRPAAIAFILVISTLWTPAASAWDDCQTSPTKVYDAAFDFLPGYTAGKNPNACWTYGWTTDLSGRLSIFPKAGISPLDNNPQQWYDPSNDNGRSPAVTRNQNGDFDNGNVTWPAGALLLTGCGSDGHSYAHVIWTAPKRGRYLVSSTFYAAQNNISADVHIFVRSRQVFSKIFNKNGIKYSFVKEFSLDVGDEIDFVSGPNGQFYLHPAHTGLNAQIISLEHARQYRDHD